MNVNEIEMITFNKHRLDRLFLTKNKTIFF